MAHPGGRQVPDHDLFFHPMAIEELVQDTIQGADALPPRRPAGIPPQGAHSHIFEITQTPAFPAQVGQEAEDAVNPLGVEVVKGETGENIIKTLGPIDRLDRFSDYSQFRMIAAVRVPIAQELFQAPAKGGVLFKDHQEILRAEVSQDPPGDRSGSRTNFQDPDPAGRGPERPCHLICEEGRAWQQRPGLPEVMQAFAQECE